MLLFISIRLHKQNIVFSTEGHPFPIELARKQYENQGESNWRDEIQLLPTKRANLSKFEK